MENGCRKLAWRNSCLRNLFHSVDGVRVIKVVELKESFCIILSEAIDVLEFASWIFVQ